MTIYNERTPYTYLIGWSKLNQYYYGRRTGKNCKPSELCVTYFTSSLYVKETIKEYGLPDIIQIRKVFTGKNKIVDCKKWEEKVLRRLRAASNPKMLNQHNGSNTFDATGKVTIIDIRTGQTKQVTVEEFKNNCYYHSVLHNKIIVGQVNETGQISYKYVLVDEYRQNKHKYIHPSEGKIWITEKSTNRQYMITVEEFHKNRSLYKHHSDNTVLSPVQIERLRRLHSNKPKKEEHKKKISEALKKYTRTPEHQQKITESNRKSKKTWHPIVINGVTYDSISNAAKALNTTAGQICNMLAGRKPIRKDFWELRKI